MLGILTVLVGALVVQSALNAWTREVPQTLRTLRALRWWMVPAGLAMIVTVGLAYKALSVVPGMSWGWYQLIAGQPGNVMLSQSTVRHGPVATMAVVIPSVLFLAVPREALAEERLFRAGSEHRSRWVRAGRCLAFGVAHCLVGVPIAAGLALTGSGLYYDIVYRRATQDGSTYPQGRRAGFVPPTSACHTAAAAHATANWILLIALLFSLVV